jgi:acetyltransferase-like isoleucine patch superfamily enzyme
VKQLLATLLSRQLVQRILRAIEAAAVAGRVKYLNRHINGTLQFVRQGEGGVEIAGCLECFSIGHRSHVKSATYIEASGGVVIGSYFHPGRCLTIFSTNHNYMYPSKIPYDEVSISGRVEIGNWVWCGANVTILPGVKVGDGAVIAANSVVTRDVDYCAVVAGNPARLVKYRDIERFERAREAGHYF